MKTAAVALVLLACLAAGASAQPVEGRVRGRVTDETGGALPGVTVELRGAAGSSLETVTAASGEYAFETLAAGRYQLSFALINFASLTVKYFPSFSLSTLNKMVP